MQPSTDSLTYLIPIHGLIRSLQQAVSQCEWDGEFDKAKATARELDHVVNYHNETGSFYYPNH